MYTKTNFMNIEYDKSQRSNFGDGDLRLDRKQMESEPVPRLRKTFTKETDSDNFVYGIPDWKK